METSKDSTPTFGAFDIGALIGTKTAPGFDVQLYDR